MEFGGAVSQRGGLETVRALHQTIVALRAALEESKNEILELKSKSWPIDSVQNVIQALSIENHVLRQQIAEASLGYPTRSFAATEQTGQELFQEFYGPTEVAEEEKYYQPLFEDSSSEIGVEDQFHEKLGEGRDSQIEDEADLGDPNRDLGETEKELVPESHRSIEEENYYQNVFKNGEEDQILEKVSISKDNQALKEETDEASKEPLKYLTGGTVQETESTAGHSREEKQEFSEHAPEDKGQESAEPIIESPTSSKSPKTKKVTIVSPKLSPKESPRKLKLETKIFLKAKKKGDSTICRSLESLTVVKSPVNKNFSFTKTVSFSNLALVSRDFSFNQNTNDTMTDQQETDRSEKSAENQYDEQLLSPQNDMDQEVDDIELIFTTDETKDQYFKEELVPIDERESNSNLLNLPLSDIDQVSDRELDDDVFNDTVEECPQDQPVNYHHQSSLEMKRDNSIFNSRSDNSINHEKSFKSYYSYQDSSFENKSLEKDESFDRFDDRVRIVETDISKCGIHEVDYVCGRRNTCPNPIQYRPLSHREVMSKGLNPRKTRPILTHSNASRRESGAQTDISALPGSAWRSESSLANKAKMGEHFTTLPSKYPLPGSRLRLSEKTVEARRVLLSDIGFTSMVPELSRSADHLFPGALKPPTVTSYGQFLKATDLYSPGCTSQKFSWAATTATPSESSQTQSRYSSIYPLSPPAPSRRCSAPVSPSRRTMVKSAPSKVRFANGSLPELRTDWTTVDSGDSTDSLVEEAENYLRRSIDCIVTNKDLKTYGESRRSVPRRASAPEPARDNIPPPGWQPFLPRLPRDLKLDNWVKVITPEGRVRGGRVRYVGPIITQGQEQFVGVQLTCPEGISDGTYGSRRYFQCEPYHGLFVPFKKVIMGWQP